MTPILHWLYLNVLGNLVASLLWAGPAVLFARFHVKKLHRRLDHQDAKMNLIHKHVKDFYGKK